MGVGVVGQSRGFAAGADLKGMAAIENREQALALGAAGHETFGRLGRLDVPTFAFYNGTALGGGLELGLHCTYRTVAVVSAVFGPSVPRAWAAARSTAPHDRVRADRACGASPVAD